MSRNSGKSKRRSRPAPGRGGKRNPAEKVATSAEEGVVAGSAAAETTEPTGSGEDRAAMADTASDDGFADDESPEAGDAEAAAESEEPIHQRGLPVPGKSSSNADLARAAKRARRRGSDTEPAAGADDEPAAGADDEPAEAPLAAEPPDRRITAAELAQALGDPDGAEEVAGDDDVDGGAADGEGEDAAEGDEGVAASFPTSANQLNETQLMCLVEALIFASDKPLTVVRLRQLTRVSDAKRLQRALDQLVQSYQGRGIAISAISGGYSSAPSPRTLRGSSSSSPDARCACRAPSSRPWRSSRTASPSPARRSMRSAASTPPGP